MESSFFFPSSTSEIPVDYKIRKFPLSLAGDDLTIYDACGNLAFRISGDRRFSSSFRDKKRKMLFDAAGNTLITVVHQNDEWQGFRGNNQEGKDLIFRVQKVSCSPFNTELNVFLTGSIVGDEKPSFRVKGNPFRRSCTILRGDSLVAQTNILYKLKKIIYSRHKFQLTIFPGDDHILITAMLITFYWR